MRTVGILKLELGSDSAALCGFTWCHLQFLQFVFRCHEKLIYKQLLKNILSIFQYILIQGADRDCIS